MSKHAVLALCFRNMEKGLPGTEVLLVCEKKRENDPKQDWMWSLPGGKCCGKKWLNSGCCKESPEKTAVREVKEETGLKSRIKKLVSSKEMLNPERQNKFMRYVYLMEITGGKLLENKTPSGSNSPQWFKLSAIPRNLFYSHQQVLLDYFKKPLR